MTLRRLSFFLALFALFACEADRLNRNPYLQELGFRFDINLNLPLYAPLLNPGNPVYVGNPGVGLRGVYVINAGFDQFRVFEASCPNHSPSECSTLAANGTSATCACDGYEYSLFTGQQLDRPDDGNRYYDMLEYRASLVGNVLSLSN